MYRQYVVNVRVSIRKSFLHLRPMYTLFIPVLLESLYVRMDIVMLGVMCIKSEVGYYENASKALIAQRMVYAITTVLMPRAANLLAQKDYKKYDRLMKQSTNITILIVSAFAFGTAAIAKEFSVIFWGTDFIRSADMIIIMALAMPAIVLSREVREQYIIPAGRDRKYMLSAAAGAMVNLLTNMILIPIYGANGAALATLIS